VVLSIFFYYLFNRDDLLFVVVFFILFLWLFWSFFCVGEVENVEQIITHKDLKNI